MSTDPYAALGLTKTATADDIKKAYRKIAKVSHPDLNPDDTTAEARFKAAQAAYDLLKDPEQRARFDRGEIDASGQEQAQRSYYRDYAEQPGNPYRSRGGRAGFGGDPGGAQGFEGDFGDASDIFAEFMRRQQGSGGRAGGQRGWQTEFSAPGQDRHYALEVSFLDAIFGARSEITLPDGGAIAVQIPAGTRDGQVIRLRGKGAPGFGDGPPGDALITLSVRPHELFERDGDDIRITLPITLDEAVLGGKVEAPTIEGPVNLTVPKGASSGQVLRLRGRGVKRRGSDQRGDQFVELSIRSPRTIDDELAAFMESWRKTNGYNPRGGMTS
ncbi:DnaJ C-terminal domain-containing protein [Chachezhania antarctica]|uniref:DnaJ C-terminal domain-containing protein n=1 Tax=Chachezhania antarctica TaxID=2340860 RepID=UPI000EB4D202|nr:J domain-containing protein [Chachezhania antarctica]|tara:strand:- start:362 stop:1348 length:987 start_codon:yes stop_codon:yes gene_type:complete